MHEDWFRRQAGVWAEYFSGAEKNGGLIAQPGDLVLIVFGVVPIAIAAIRAYLGNREPIPVARVPIPQ